MRRYKVCGPALGALLLASPAWAQPMPHPGSAQETLGGQREPATMGLAGREARAADEAGATQGPVGWLKEAQDALRRGRTAEANELLERAETRVLSRATPAPLAEQPLRTPVLEHSAAARAALAAHDRGGAMQQIEMAMMAARGMADSATGAGGGAMPAQGGSAGADQDVMGPGMSRDSRISRPGSAQRGQSGLQPVGAGPLSPPMLPPRLLRVQSSQAPANSMTESQTAAPGQRMPTPAVPGAAPPGRSTMPAQRSGTNAPMQGRSGGSTTRPNAAGNGSGITGAQPGGGGSAGGSAN